MRSVAARAIALTTVDELPVEPLTTRELEVLQHLAAGQRNREIAAALSVSVKTVESHVRHIMQKLGAHSRTEAVVTAQRLGRMPNTRVYPVARARREAYK